MKMVDFYNRYISQWNKNSRWEVRKQYIGFLLSFMQKHGRQIEILDLGCGCGQDEVIFADMLCSSGYLFHGLAIDQNVKAVALSRQRLENCHITNWDVMRGDFLSCRFNRRFDIVLCSMIVMHYKDTGLFINHIASAVDAHGLMMLVVNNPYLVVDEFGIKYEEGLQYTHSFMTKNGEISVSKYFHTLQEYVNSAFQAGLHLVGMKEIVNYSEQLSFFNKQGLPKSLPNFIAMVFKKEE